MMTLTPAGEPGRLRSRWGAWSREARRDGTHIRYLSTGGHWESYTPLEDAEVDFVPDPPTDTEGGTP